MPRLRTKQQRQPDPVSICCPALPYHEQWPWDSVRLCVIAKLNHASSFQRHSFETNTISSLHSVGWAEERKEGKNHHQKTSLTKVLVFPPAGEDEKALSPDQLLKHRKPERPCNQPGLRRRLTLLPVIFWFQPADEKPGLEFCCRLWLQLLARMGFVSGEPGKRWVCYFSRYSQ